MSNIEYDDLKRIQDYRRGYQNSPFPAIICDMEFSVLWSNSAAQVQCPGLVETGPLRELLAEFGYERLIADLQQDGSVLLDNVFFLRERRINLLPIYHEGAFTAVLLLMLGAEERASAAGRSISSVAPAQLIDAIRGTTENIYRALDNLAEKSGIIGLGWMEEHLNRIAWHSSNMLRTATNINTYIALQGDEEQDYSYSMTDLFGWLEDIRDTALTVAEGCGILLRFEVNEEEDCRVALHPSRFEVAFFNLLNNSLRYTPPGGEITVSAWSTASEVCVSVQDNGPGIPPELHEEIFRPYVTIAHEGVACGTGLGLTVSRRIIRAMQGELQVISEEGKGSEFIIRLPIGTFSHPLSLRQADPDHSFQQNSRFTPRYVGLAGLGKESRGES